MGKHLVNENFGFIEFLKLMKYSELPIAREKLLNVID
jgi:hypothetical protein